MSLNTTKPTADPSPVTSLCRAVAEHSPVPMATLDGTKLSLCYVNLAFCLLMEKSEEQLIGKSLAELLPIKDACLDLIERVIRTGEPETFTEQQDSKPHPFFWSFTVWPVTVSERPVGLMLQVTETAKFHRKTVEMNEALILSAVRQQKLLEEAESLNLQLQAERETLRDLSERFQTLADNISPLAWMANPDGWIFWYNKRWYDYTGTNFEEMQGWGWGKLHHPEHIERIIKRWKEKLEAGELWEDSFPLRGADGNYRWFLSRARPIRDKNGNIVRIFGTNVDITELREAQSALAAANEQLASHATHLEVLVQQRTEKLRETVGELEAFSYSVSHDMRAPLRTMQGFAKILLEEHSDRLDEQGKDFLNRIKRGSERLDLLVQDVLAYSRVAKGEHELSAVDLNGLIAEIIEQHGFGARADFDIARPLPTVMGHEALLSQVISNLIGNAIKFVSPGVRPRVLIRAELCNDKVRISVEDNGIGIDPIHFETIFQIFGRIYSENEYEGTGIGLAVVKKAVERMGGQMGIESEVGKGSRFWFLLPHREQNLSENSGGNPSGPR